MDIRTWFEHWEPIWLFAILFIETAIGFLQLSWIKREYFYDEQKDIEKKQRRTKTTKKTTTQPGGASVVEESVETSEPIKEEPKHD